MALTEEPSTADEETRSTLERMKRYLDKQDELGVVEPSTELMPGNMEMEGALIAAQLGHGLGRQGMEWHERYALNFSDVVYRTVLTAAKAQNGIRNLASMIGKKHFPWTTIALIAAVTIFGLVIFSSPTNTTNFGAWVSGNNGLNGVALVFLVGLTGLVVYWKKKV